LPGLRGQIRVKKVNALKNKVFTLNISHIKGQIRWAATVHAMMCSKTDDLLLKKIMAK